MTRKPNRPRVLALAAAAVLWGSGDVRADGSPAAICADAIGAVERLHRFPSELLWAVALLETGRWDRQRQARFAWPWTVTAEGKGRYLPSREAAIAHVQALRARGVRNIDVGCMQVNLMWHPKAFASLDEAFDPRTNAAYAGRLVDRLWRSTRSWSQAVRRYHSSHSRRGRDYWRRFLPIWNDERRIASERVRQQHIEAYRKRQAERRARRLARR